MIESCKWQKSCSPFNTAIGKLSVKLNDNLISDYSFIVKPYTQNSSV